MSDHINSKELHKRQAQYRDVLKKRKDTVTISGDMYPNELNAELLELLQRFVDNSSCQVNQPIECYAAEELIARIKGQADAALQGSTAENVCKWHTRYIIGGTRFVYMDCKSNPKERLTIYCEHCGGKVELEEEQ